MSEYREKFLEAEKQALSLVEQLETLKKEASDYKSASGSLQKTQEKIDALVTEFSSVVEGEQNLIKALKEIGTEKILEEVEMDKTALEEFSKNQNKLFSRLFLFIYGILGFSVILGILIFIFR